MEKSVPPPAASKQPLSDRLPGLPGSRLTSAFQGAGIPPGRPLYLGHSVMPSGIRPLLLLMVLFFVAARVGAAGEMNRDEVITVTAEFSYACGDKDSARKARALALYGARLKAVKVAAKYLTHKGLLEHYEKKENEIYCLAADEINISRQEEGYREGGKIYYAKITSAISNVDFIRAHIKDLAFDKEEAHFPYGKEMEQPVLKDIDPGQELSRAYRYIRKQEWRIAIIYLDHLEKKYPCWGDLYLAKAIAFYGINADPQMIEALRKACSFNNQEACNELQSFEVDVQ
jgi:hypothetical protein